MFVSSGDFDQNVLGVKSDFRMIRVDDRRKRTNGTVGIENDRVNR